MIEGWVAAQIAGSFGIAAVVRSAQKAAAVLSTVVPNRGSSPGCGREPTSTDTARQRDGGSRKAR
jgi:hypothetical protein